MTQAIPITGPLAASPRAGALAVYGDTPSGSPLLVGEGLGVRYA
jgi:hypothetical protein